MNIIYKHQEPEIILQPNVYAMFEHISKNVKTNLIWTCLVRKLGSKYIIEDIYVPPQNVNSYFMCNFDEEYLSNVTAAVFNNDYRMCRFNMIGRFTMEKSPKIDDSAIKTFEKLAHISLDEFLMMQLNKDGEMEFAISRKATILTELDYSVDLSELINKSSFERMLTSKIGEYKVSPATDNGKVVEMKRTTVAESERKATKKSELLINNISWKDVI